MSNLAGYENLAHDVNKMLDTLVPKEAEVQLRDGRWYLMRIQPYRTLENVIEGAVITFVNITQQKKMQATEALLRSETAGLRRLVGFSRASGDAISVLDFFGRILAWNPAAVKLYGWSEAEAVQSNMRDHLAPEEFEELEQPIRRVARGEDVGEVETERGTREGCRLRVRTHLTALLNSDGNPYAVTVIERAANDAPAGE